VQGAQGTKPYAILLASTALGVTLVLAGCSGAPPARSAADGDPPQAQGEDSPVKVSYQPVEADETAAPTEAAEAGEPAAEEPAADSRLTETVAADEPQVSDPAAESPPGQPIDDPQEMLQASLQA
jgi:hypothetical protein